MTNKTYTTKKTDENLSKKQKILAMEKIVVTSGILYVRLVVLLYRIVSLGLSSFCPCVFGLFSNYINLISGAVMPIEQSQKIQTVSKNMLFIML